MKSRVAAQFLIVGGSLVQPASTAAEPPDAFAAANDFRASMVAQAAYMQEIGRAMPEAHYHERPVAAVRTFAEQLLHLAAGLVGMTGAAAGEMVQIDTDAKGKTKAEVLRIVDEAFDHATRMAEQISDADLDERIPWQSRLLEAPTVSKRQVLAVAGDHLAHHRGQLIVYLRLEGIEPPTYVGF